MTHLTTHQLLQFIDGTLDYASQAQCTSHLAVCARCRKEVDLQKSIAKVSRSQRLVKAPGTFTQRVMARVAPKIRPTWRSRLVDNLGNVFAMAMVLAFLGYAISTPSMFNVQKETSQPSAFSKTITGAYESVIKALSVRTTEAAQKVTVSSDAEQTRVFVLTLISILILVVIDQFVLKRYVRMNTRH
jgi:anti-sigma factor RsiW